MGWTTLSVKDDTATRFKQLKENADTSEDLSADRFLTLLLNGWEHGTKDDGESNGESINGVAEAIVDRIEETQGVTIENVEVDAGSTLTREEVEGVVENWVGRNYDRLRRGEI